MSGQQVVSPEHKLKRKRVTWLFWVALGVILTITLALGVLVFWIIKTQDLSKSSSIVSLIASIVVILCSPLVLLFTIAKWPERQPAEPPVPSTITPTQPAPALPITQGVASLSLQLLNQQPLTHTVWNIPYRRNPFFTGRESVLEEVHRRLTTTKATALKQPQAINGLGGIGKTQIAVEYAYRHRDEYHDVVWVNAATRETIISSFLELAETLQLPEKQEQDQSKVVAAIQHWFIAHDHWLLIFDNADDLTLAEEYLPASENGHRLLTTRQQSLGTLADSIDIDTMDKDEGTLLILRRANLLAKDAPLAHAKPEDRTQAERIVAVLDGFPLALDQAAAYIEETRCSLTTFLETYQDARADLLRRRGRTGKDHPLPVATTWKLAFKRVQRANPSAADLLHVCAFLAPDAIPEDMLIAGASELGPHLAVLKDHPLQWNEAIAKLLDFSLIRRTREKRSLAIHRLVQEVLRMQMDEPTRKTWAERCVRAMNEAFPPVDFTTWSQCERYLVHALQGAELIHEYALEVPEADSLLHQTALYLYERAQYAQAEPLYQEALRISKKVEGPEHPSTATTMHALASLYQNQGRYAEAEPLYQEVLRIYQKALPPEHPDTASTMHELARLYQAQGRYAEAEPLYQYALAIYEKTLGSDHPSTRIVRTSYKQFLAKAKKKKISG